MDELLNHAPCGFISFRDNGTVIQVNQTLKSLLNLDGVKLIGNSVESIFTLSTRIFYNTHFFPLVKLHQSANEIFLTLQTSDGTSIPVLTNATRKQEHDGQHRIDCILITIFQRQRYEEQILASKKAAEDALQENKRLKELTKELENRSEALDNKTSQLQSLYHDYIQFNRIVTHDFREPIRKIKVFADMLERDPKRTGETIKKILRAVKRIDGLTNSLEQLTNTGMPAHSQVDLNDVVELARQKVANSLDFYDFDFQVDNLGMFNGDKKQLTDLFSHLFDNAIHYRAKNVKLSISITCEVTKENMFRYSHAKYRFVDHLHITFSDNGVGIEDQYHLYVFDILKKAELHSKGMGMGLSLCKRIVENHGGSITIRAAETQGTVVRISFPLVTINRV
jgi:phosphoserine phosphatase RsbU/P